MKLFKRGEQTPPEADADGIVGERGTPSVVRAPSLQSRVSSALAMGLMSVIGLGLLTWYYARTWSAPSQAREKVVSAARTQAQGEVSLPPIGPVEMPLVESSTMFDPPEPLPPENEISRWGPSAVRSMPSDAAAVSLTSSPEVLALERKLSGAVVAHASRSAAAESVTSPELDADGSDAASFVATDGGPMAALLKPSVTPAVHARVLPTTRLLLPKGAFVDCTLETAIDSTLPGMTTCVTATDTYGVDGSVVLMERGSKLIGETRGQVQQGAARLFVLWTEARTPTGVVIPLASPGTDELGRSGLPGQVNRHFFERFGAAILVSVIDGAVQREVQAQGNGTVIYDPSGSQDIATEVLKSTINIPPTITKPQGDRIQVLVARDLDFRSVYALRPVAAAR